ncbi:MAG: ABC transporter ATP-binding protein [Anaerolineaceae bacterium]|jgi:iron complex transport system ATP-binding protein|nr:ABC transporter ATP-binding protein [Anaerolineaceae bacterium]
MLLLKSLTAAYGSKIILRDISLSLRKGTILAVIGPNGAGKSTLIRAISGVISISSGEIKYQGQNIEKFSPIERSRLMAVVPQALLAPPAFSAWDTVLTGRTPHLNWLGQLSEQDRNIARQSMQRTDTIGLKDRYVNQLSGGEQQRVLLARALAQSTPILLMDEPTTHLDLQYQVNIMEHVKSLVKHDGISVLIAMHDLNLVARYADEIALLVDGTIRAFGSPKEILKPDLLSEVYRIPLQVVSFDKDETLLVIPKKNVDY